MESSGASDVRNRRRILSSRCITDPRRFVMAQEGHFISRLLRDACFITVFELLCWFEFHPGRAKAQPGGGLQNRRRPLSIQHST
jgi:hypothetical protein